MKKSFFILYAVIFAFNVSAQLLDHNWYFSVNSKGLFFDYTTNAISVTNEHNPISATGSGVAADSITGEVLFYTSGATVWDASHLEMPNGMSLIGGLSCAQTGLVCYVPGQTNRYYIFSNNADQPTPGNVYYSIVDMTLAGNGDSQNPKGDIDPSFKNISIVDSSSEAMIVVPGSNNNFWLLIPKAYSDEISVFEISTNGINYYNSFFTSYSLISPTSIRYSKESGKVAIGSMIESDPVVICDFNYSTGLFSNSYEMPGSPFGTNSTLSWYGIVDFEWSSDGSKLYISKYRESSPVSAGKLFQYDLNFPNNNPVVIFSIPSNNSSYLSFGLKRGPDNKIYYLYKNPTYSDCRFIGVINSPNISGSNCNFNPMGINMGSLSSNTHKFPEFLIPYNNSVYVDPLSYSINLISVYPNPFSDNINIQYSLEKACIVTFELLDIKGRVIESFNKKIDTGYYTCSLNEFKNLNNGIYIIKMVVDNNVYIEKLIKN